MVNFKIIINLICEKNVCILIKTITCIFVAHFAPIMPKGKDMQDHIINTTSYKKNLKNTKMNSNFDVLESKINLYKSILMSQELKSNY